MTMRWRGSSRCPTVATALLHDIDKTKPPRGASRGGLKTCSCVPHPNRPLPSAYSDLSMIATAQVATMRGAMNQQSPPIDAGERTEAPMGAEHISPRSLDEIDRANIETGFRLARSLALQNAALDPRLPPACVRVMAALGYFMNDKTMRAWPSYELLAEVTGYTHDVIDRAIRKLKATGYLRTRRHAPITGGRALVHYGYGRIDAEFLDRLIADAVAQIKARKADTDKNVGVSLTQTKKSGSDDPTLTFSSVPDSDFLSPQEPIKNRNPISAVFASAKRNAAPKKAQAIDDEVRPTKRKGRPTGKRPWEWVHQSERDDLSAWCEEFADGRGWTREFLAERLRAFELHQRMHKLVSADWKAGLEQWLSDPRFQPRPGRSSNLAAVIDRLGWGDDE